MDFLFKQLRGRSKGHKPDNDEDPEAVVPAVFPAKNSASKNPDINGDNELNCCGNNGNNNGRNDAVGASVVVHGLSPSSTKMANYTSEKEMLKKVTKKKTTSNILNDDNICHRANNEEKSFSGNGSKAVSAETNFTSNHEGKAAPNKISSEKKKITADDESQSSKQLSKPTNAT